jgi:hypothetical protein
MYKTVAREDMRDLLIVVQTYKDLYLLSNNIIGQLHVIIVSSYTYPFLPYCSFLLFLRCYPCRCYQMSMKCLRNRMIFSISV